MSSANGSNEVVEVEDMVVAAKTVEEKDHPGTRGAKFVGGPNPPLLFSENGVDVQATVLGNRLH